MSDIFDQIELHDVFDQIESDRIGDKIFNEVEKELPSLVRTYVKEQTKKIKTLSPKEVSDLIDAAISNIPSPKPVDRIIEKTIQKIQVLPPKDTKKYAELEQIQNLEKQIKELKSLLNNREQGIQVVGDMLPNYSGSSGKVLSNDGSQLKWVSGGGSVSGSSDIYTPTNVTTTRSFDATDTSLDEIASVLGSLIASLKGVGIVQ